MLNVKILIKLDIAKKLSNIKLHIYISIYIHLYYRQPDRRPQMQMYVKTCNDIINVRWC